MLLKQKSNICHFQDILVKLQMGGGGVLKQKKNLKSEIKLEKATFLC